MHKWWTIPLRRLTPGFRLIILHTFNLSCSRSGKHVDLSAIQHCYFLLKRGFRPHWRLFTACYFLVSIIYNLSVISKNELWLSKEWILTISVFSNKPKQCYLVLYFRDRIFKEMIKGTVVAAHQIYVLNLQSFTTVCMSVFMMLNVFVWARDTSRELLPRVKRSLSLPQQQWTHWSSLMVCLEEVDQSRRVNGKAHMFGKADINHAYTQSDLFLSE